MDNKLGVYGSAKIKVQELGDIARFRPLHMVLVEITQLMHDKITIKGDGVNVNLEIDNSFDRVAHAIRIGTVISIPRHIPMGNGREKMPWRVPIEIEPGDLVLFSYDPITRILNGTDPLLTFEGRYFIMVPYHNIAMFKRGEQIAPVNGYVIMEPVDINTEDKILGYHQNFKTPDAIGKSASDKIGIVRYVGAPVDEYYGVPQAVDDIDIKVGDKIIYRPKTDIPLEDNLHTEFLPIKGLFKIQRRYMLLKLE